MRRDLAIAWVVSFCSLSLRKSQAKTLSILVAAAMRVQRASMANLGRSMGGMVKHQMIPRSIKVVILADRGFGRTALATFCQQQGLGYLIRIQPSVTVRLKGFHGKLMDYPVKKGIAKVLKRVAYRSDEAVTQTVVVHWRRGLPPKRDECWFLMTDQPGTAHQLCRLYGRRMTIEQLFRDDKSKRNGWSLRDTRITKPDRIDRMLLILAIAYLLLCGVVLDQPGQRVQHLYDRDDHAGENQGQPAAGIGRRCRIVRTCRAKLGMTQRGFTSKFTSFSPVRARFPGKFAVRA
jgi:hypothetical protein